MKHNLKKKNHESKTKLKKYKRRVKNWKLIIKIFLPALHLTELPNKACHVYVSFIAFLLLCQHQACPSSFFSISTASFLGFSLYMYLLLLFYSCFLSLCTTLLISLWLLPSPFLVFLMFFSLSFSFLAAKVSCTYCLLPFSFFVALV